MRGVQLMLFTADRGSQIEKHAPGLGRNLIFLVKWALICLPSVTGNFKVKIFVSGMQAKKYENPCFSELLLFKFSSVGSIG